MTTEQENLKGRRLFLEEQIWSANLEISAIHRACADHIGHVIHKGQTIWSPRQGKVVNTMAGKPDNWNDGCYSVSCEVCGKDFGWHCPVNPKGYCEYGEGSYGDCIHCHIPEERK